MPGNPQVPACCMQPLMLFVVASAAAQAVRTDGPGVFIDTQAFIHPTQSQVSLISFVHQQYRLGQGSPTCPSQPVPQPPSDTKAAAV